MNQTAIQEQEVVPHSIKANGKHTEGAVEVQPQVKAAPVAKKASKLKAVAPKSAEPSKPKILIFGKPGVGKTWASLDFPSVYYIDTEGGANLSHYTDKLARSGGVYMGPEQGASDFLTVIEQLKALGTEEHQYKTVVIDSVSKIFGSIIAREEERLGDSDAFGASKKPAVALTRRLISWIDKIDMNVILIAHERALWGKDAKGNQTQIGVTYDGWDKLEYELHLNLNIVKQGESRKAFVKKSRLLGFPDASCFEWSYAKFAELYGKEVIERQGKKTDLATPEQIAEVLKLLAVVKLSDSTQDKWIADNKDGLDEVEASKIEKIITHLKGKIS
jgi:hypothetical protein